MVFINGNSARCKDCVFFRYMSAEEKGRKKYESLHDGICYKRFPRGYYGIYFEKHDVWSRQMSCFQFEIKDSEQVKMEV